MAEGSSTLQTLSRTAQKCRNGTGCAGPHPLAGNATCARNLSLPRRVGAGLWSRDQAPSDRRSYSSTPRITGTEHDALNRSCRVPATRRARLAPRSCPPSPVATPHWASNCAHKHPTASRRPAWLRRRKAHPSQVRLSLAKPDATFRRGHARGRQWRLALRARPYGRRRRCGRRECCPRRGRHSSR
jgi:hypothetical protein